MSSHLGSAVVWNMDGEQAIGKPLGGPTDLATDVAFSPRRHLARHGPVRRRHDRVRHGDSTTGGPDRSGDRSSPQSPSTPTGTSSPSERSTGRCASSTRRAGEPSVPARRGRVAVWQIAFSPDGRLLAVAADPNGVDGFSRPAAAGRGAALGRGLPDVAWGGRSRPAVDRCSPSRSTGRHAAGDRQLPRAARPLGRGHPGRRWRADEGGR